MKHKIVFVDDDPKVVKALKRLFTKESFEYYGFNSPRQALEQMNKISPQVVLSDQQMPGMEGIRFLEEVQERWPNTIRMILTGFLIPDSVQGAISRAGILKVLNKPWNDLQLLQQIHIAFHYFDLQRFTEIWL